MSEPGSLFKLGSPKSVIAGFLVFGLGVFVGREWMKQEIRDAIGSAFSGGRSSTRPAEPWRPPAFTFKGARGSLGSCYHSLEITDPGSAGYVKFFAIGESGNVIDSRSVKLPMERGGLVEVHFIDAKCDAIKNVKVQKDH